MKILFISMPSIHVIRWIENLKDTSFELYWYDILDRGKLETLETVTQFSGQKRRKLPPIKGEFYMSKKLPRLYNAIKSSLEVTENELLEKIITDIKPDIVHSFEMQHCSYPILKTMNKFRHIKWIYSCWGSDIFYFKNLKTHVPKIRAVLQRTDYMITDCQRDYELAKDLGFTGTHLGIIPGGTGYTIEDFKEAYRPISERKIILVKGYEHQFGRALNVIKALEKVAVSDYEVVVFGAHKPVADYIKNKNLTFKVFSRHGWSHQELIQWMGKSLVYIGNSISDGIPNTLLEAILMGAFPIQSNPGNVTAEIIQDGVNGLLINEPENIENIALAISKALSDKKMLEAAAAINKKIAVDRLDFDTNRKKVLNVYNSVACE